MIWTSNLPLLSCIDLLLSPYHPPLNPKIGLAPTDGSIRSKAQTDASATPLIFPRSSPVLFVYVLTMATTAIAPHQLTQNEVEFR
ncbi:hypothetical protein ACFX2I_007191 [Malus domestica]